jgi:RNA polymerase sigma factor (TIGR02999 family)
MQQHDLSALIKRAEDADPQAVEELFAALYQELHRLAEHHLRRGGANNSLGATTLLHEAYLNVANREGITFTDRNRFFAYASRAMRGLVIDYARQRRTLRKGGRQFEITLTEDVEGSLGFGDTNISQLGEALEQLTGIDASLAELVDLHFFCGFSFSEIAQFRDVSERTVQRDWRKARMLLHNALSESSDTTHHVSRS